MRKFRFFMALAMLAGMFACQNEFEQQDVVLEVEKPDVYAENGYLVFKDHNTMDSVCKMVGSKSQDEFEIWEKQMGFHSARSLSEKYFLEYEKISSIQEWNAFKTKYKQELNIADEDKMEDVLFPFESETWSAVINEKGMFKVGESLIICDQGRTMSILDGDETKIEMARTLKESNSEQKIILSPVNDSFKSLYLNHNHVTLKEWKDYEVGKRKLRSRLEYRQFTYYVKDTINPSTKIYHLVTQYYVWQKGLKKTWLGWISYKTILGIKDIEIYTQMCGYGYLYPSQYSSETKSAYFLFLQYVEKVIVDNGDIPSPTNSFVDNSLCIAFKQYSRGIGQWINKDGDDVDLCYPSTWTIWKNQDFYSNGSPLGCYGYIDYDDLDGN